MTEKKEPQGQLVAPRRGLMHVVDATRYSLAGFRRLMGETAARQELAFGAGGLAALVWAGATGAELGIFVLLFLILLAIEAINTAIEVLVDHLSPEWSQMAKDAKDLGSLAVGLVLAGMLGFVVWVLAT